MTQEPRIAIVHDWLTNLGGAERVVKVMLEAFPQADLYTSVYRKAGLSLFRDYSVHTSWLQHWPLAQRKHQLYPVLRRLAFESFDFSDYNLVISSSTAESKGVITSERTKHLSYINTPTRYYWSGYQDYIKDPGFGWLDPIVRWQLQRSIKSSRYWDYAAAQRPDRLLANSTTVQGRIQKYYHRHSEVVWPPVDLARMQKPHDRPDGAPERYLLVLSRLIPYKRVDLAVAAARRAGWSLVVIGTGSQQAALEKMAGPQTIFTGQLSDDEVVAYLQHASALLFPGEEDFGIVPVEAMAAGVPVIAYGAGGALDTVAHRKTGILVKDQSVSSFSAAIRLLDHQKFDPKYLAQHVEQFSQQNFQTQLKRAAQDLLESARS